MMGRMDQTGVVGRVLRSLAIWSSAVNLGISTVCWGCL